MQSKHRLSQLEFELSLLIPFSVLLTITSPVLLYLILSFHYKLVTLIKHLSYAWSTEWQNLNAYFYCSTLHLKIGSFSNNLPYLFKSFSVEYYYHTAVSFQFFLTPEYFHTKGLRAARSFSHHAHCQMEQNIYSCIKSSYI